TRPDPRLRRPAEPGAGPARPRVPRARHPAAAGRRTRCRGRGQRARRATPRGLRRVLAVGIERHRRREGGQAMKAWWARSAARYAALARRERGLVLAATLALIVGLGLLLFIEPALKQRALLQRQITQQQADLDALQPQVALLKSRQRDPDAATRQQLEALRQQMRLADGEFEQLQRALVAPQDMGRLLESLLHGHRGLQLIALRNVPVVSVSELMAPAKPAAAAPAAS